MTIKQIKKESVERFTVSRFKAMPAYSVVFFVLVNISILTALMYALTLGIENFPLFASILIWCYGGLLIFMSLCLSGPFSYSAHEYFLKVSENGDKDASVNFGGYKARNFARTLIAQILRFVFTLLLTCLLIVPGVIFSVKTSMMYFEMSKNPKMGAFAAFKASSAAMKKHSMKYFGMSLTFIGWFLICILTFGLGFIYVLPYFNSCKAIFYRGEIGGENTGYSESDDTVADEEYANVAEEPAIKAEYAEPEAAQAEETVEILPVEDTEDDIVTIVEPAPVSESSDGNDEAVIIAPAPEPEQESEAEQATVIPAEPVKPVPEKAKAEPKIEVVKPVKPEITPEEAEKNSAKEAIKQRIEQLKRERNKSNNTRPHRPERSIDRKPPAATITPVAGANGATQRPAPSERKEPRKADEFAPEKIEVELVEDE